MTEKADEGASATRVPCEICGREKRASAGYLGPFVPCYREWTGDVRPAHADAACWALGYEREKAAHAADVAEAQAFIQQMADEHNALQAAAQRLVTEKYRPWETPGGGEQCDHGYNIAIPCRRCDLALVFESRPRTGNADASPPPKEKEIPPHSLEET